MQENATIRADEISGRLKVSKPTVYLMLKGGMIPALRTPSRGRPGRGRWVIGRTVYMEWESKLGKGEA